MAYDNQRRERGLFPAFSFVTRILPQSVVASAARPIEAAQPGSPSQAAPPLADMQRYTERGKEQQDYKLLDFTPPSPPPPPPAAPQGHGEWMKFERSRYRYAAPDKNPIYPIALAERVPITAYYGLSWALPYLPVFVPVVSHVLANRVRFAWEQVRGKFDRFSAYRQIFKGVLSPLGDMPLPQPVHDYFEDAAFARQRLDGPNPLLIARVDSLWLSLHMPDLTPAKFLAVTGADLSLALANNTLYACDYGLLQRSLLPPGPRDSRWRETYLPAPIVLFWYAPGHLAGSDLVPVAIQVDQPGAVVMNQPDYTQPAVPVPVPLYTPQDGPAWALAKQLVQTADQNHQVNSTHIGRTHWVVEPFALAVPRQLPPDHPLYVLFEPHIRFTLAVNDTTIPLITERGKIFGTIYAGTLEETRQIMITTHAEWGFKDLDLEADLQKRGMDTYPGHYPYREDARRLWTATRKFVHDYLRVFYEFDGQVAADEHLQNFVAELQDPARGNLHGLPLPTGGLATFEELVTIAAQLVFTAGPQHAAVHYPQLEYFSYVPASAGAAWRPPPLGAAEVTPDRALDTLPPTHNAVVQFQTDSIGSYRYDRFGRYHRYRLGRLADPQIQQILATFRADLQAIEAEIQHDNHTIRVRPYVYLLPSGIPNSINI